MSGRLVFRLRCKFHARCHDRGISHQATATRYKVLSGLSACVRHVDPDTVRLQAIGRPKEGSQPVTRRPTDRPTDWEETTDRLDGRSSAATTGWTSFIQRDTCDKRQEKQQRQLQQLLQATQATAATAKAFAAYTPWEHAPH